MISRVSHFLAKECLKFLGLAFLGHMAYNRLNKRAESQRTPGRRKLSYKNSAQFTRRRRYFLCLKYKTRVITAQSIITKENKSLYVTIGTSPFQKISAADISPLRLPW